MIGLFPVTKFAFIIMNMLKGEKYKYVYYDLSYLDAHFMTEFYKKQELFIDIQQIEYLYAIHNF
jgi:hypothetical protein